MNWILYIFAGVIVVCFSAIPFIMYRLFRGMPNDPPDKVKKDMKDIEPNYKDYL